jgi:hypothetical protein
MSETKLTLAEKLQEPFDPKSIGWKPQTAPKNGRALAAAYIDARDVMNRLDEVVGPENWSTTYELTPNGVVCHLAICVDGRWITKTDVGAFSKQAESGDKLKAAFSDALKRAGIQWGIGRYLYALPTAFADYDEKKKEFTRVPQLPKWALPYAQQENRERVPAAPPAPIETPEPEEAEPAPAPRQREIKLTLPEDSRKILLDQFHALERSWNAEKTKAWAGKILGRTLPADMHIGELTQHEADMLFVELDKLAKSKVAKKQPATSGAK